MVLAFHLQVMDLRVEGLANLTCRAAEIDNQLVGIDRVDFEPLRLEPNRHRSDSSRGSAVLLPEFRRCDPMVKERRRGVVDILDELLKGLLPLRSPAQLKNHVAEHQVIGDPPAIVSRLCFRARIAPEGSQLALSRVRHSERACLRVGIYSTRRRGGCKRRPKVQSKDQNRCALHLNEPPQVKATSQAVRGRDRSWWSLVTSKKAAWTRRGD